MTFRGWGGYNEAILPKQPKEGTAVSQRILVVDDEPEIADLIEVYLKSEGFEVVKCLNGTDALKVMETQSVDLALLDVMLPDISGFTLCGEVRKKYHFPVVMLTAKTGDMDKITGLTIGADDYITKPFNPLELMARVKAQLRRSTRYNEAGRSSADMVDLNGLVICRATHEAKLYDRDLGLTPLEFDILWLLAANRGQVISAEQLFESVWGEKYLDRNNTVMVHIRRLREKMGEPSRNPKFIKTVWGVGYKID